MLGLVNVRRMLPILCVVFSMIALIYLSQDHFVAHVGNATRVITREGNPVEYWGVAASFIVMAVACFAGSLYLQRR